MSHWYRKLWGHWPINPFVLPNHCEWNSTNLDRKQDLNVLYQVCVFQADRKNKMAAWPLIGWDIFDFFSETAEWNSTKLDRNQDWNALYQVCVFFRRIGKTKWPPWPLIGWDIFDFSSKTTERNSAILDRKQALNAFYHVCVFQANRETTKWPPWPLIGWDIFDFSSETVKGIRRNLIGSKISMPSTKFVFFRWIGKTKWPP